MAGIEDLPLESLRRIEKVCDAFEAGHREDLDFAAFVTELKPTDFSAIERSALIAELVKIDIELRQAKGWPVSEHLYTALHPDDRAACSTLLETIADTANQPERAGETTRAKHVVRAKPIRGSQPVAKPKSAPEKSANWPYELVRVIGQGGMGKVYLARQTAPIVREVALKIIEADKPAPEILKRFELERQALAVMDHDNIARVFDAGRTPDSQPFFSMELVDGSAITDYCDKHSISLRKRLQLFVQTCRAVQHAHQKGIIHRDLKPSNVLVTMTGGQPQVKVIDFGLAKAVHGTSVTTASSLHTQYGQVMGTLAYMSPEQAELSNLDVDTRTDVYSLGAMLYELLVGSTPIQKKELNEASFLDALRMVKELDPTRPSVRLGQNSATRRLIAKRCGLNDQRLTKVLATDLDWIVLKALQRMPADRYETPAALESDVVSFVRGEAVSATPPSTVYRLRKIVAKNRLLFASLAAVMTALVLGLFGTISMWLVSRESEKRASQSATAATNEAAKARAAEKSERSAKLEMQGQRDRALRAEANVRSANSRINYNLAVARVEAGRSLEAVEYLAQIPHSDRELEWYIANRRAEGSYMTLFGHSREIVEVDTSCDGQWIASTDGLDARVWDATTGELLRTERNAGRVAFSRSGKLLAVSGPAEVRVIDCRAKVGESLESAPVVATWQLSSELRGVKCLAWTVDDRLLAGAGNGDVHVWDIAADTRRSFEAHGTGLTEIVVDPLGGHVVTATAEEDFSVWDTVTFERKSILPAHKVRNLDLSFSPDGKTITTVGRDGYYCMVRLWSAEFTKQDQLSDAEQNPKELWGRRYSIDEFPNCVAFSPEGGRIAVGLSNAKLRVLDVAKGETLEELAGHWGSVEDVCFSADGFRVVSGGDEGAVKCWTVGGEAGIRLASRSRLGTISTLAFSPDSQRLAAAGTVPTIWDAAGRLRIGKLRGSISRGKIPTLSDLRFGLGEVTAASGDGLAIWNQSPATEISRDSASRWTPAKGTVVAAYSKSGDRIAFRSNDELTVWDVASRNRLATVPIKQSSYYVPVVFASGDKELIVADRQDVLSVWDIEKGTLADRLRLGVLQDGMWGSSDGRYLACFDVHDESLTIVDLQQRRRRATLMGHTGRVQAVEFCRNGSRVISCGTDRKLKIWDVESGEELMSLACDEEYRSLAISKDEYRIAYGTQFGTLGILDARPHAPVKALVGHRNVVRQAFIGAADRVYTTSETEKFIWDAQTGQRLFDNWPEGLEANSSRDKLNTRYHLTKRGKTVIVTDLEMANTPSEQEYRRARSRPSVGFFAEEIERAGSRGDHFALTFLNLWDSYMYRNVVERPDYHHHLSKLTDQQQASIDQLAASLNSVEH